MFSTLGLPRALVCRCFLGSPRILSLRVWPLGGLRACCLVSTMMGTFPFAACYRSCPCRLPAVAGEGLADAPLSASVRFPASVTSSVVCPGEQAADGCGLCVCLSVCPAAQLLRLRFPLVSGRSWERRVLGCFSLRFPEASRRVRSLTVSAGVRSLPGCGGVVAGPPRRPACQCTASEVPSQLLLRVGGGSAQAAALGRLLPCGHCFPPAWLFKKWPGAGGGGQVMPSPGPVSRK